MPPLTGKLTLASGAWDYRIYPSARTLRLYDSNGKHIEYSFTEIEEYCELNIVSWKPLHTVIEYYLIFEITVDTN